MTGINFDLLSFHCLIGWFRCGCYLTFAQHHLSPLAAFTSSAYFLHNGRRFLHCQLQGYCWRPIVRMCLATSNNLLLGLQDAPKWFFFHELAIFWSAKKDAMDPLSLVIFATATVVAFVLLRNYRFSFHSYTQREATPTQKSAQKWCCNLSWLLVQKITKGIHLCKPASLNCPIHTQGVYSIIGNTFVESAQFTNKVRKTA